MNIYLASRFDNRFLLREWRGQLERLGHKVVSHWIDRADAPTREAPEWPLYARAWAQQDIADIVACDVMIILTDEKSRNGGMHVEFGVALAQHKPIIHVDPKSNVFYHLPQVTYAPSFEAACTLLTYWRPG